nr:hypothetical protein [Halostagnicola kamekurae]
MSEQASLFDFERDDLTNEQRQEIAETLSTRVVSFEAEQSVTIDRD